VVSTAGLAMFALGLTLETAADGQKWLFKGDPANVGRFCDAGVWKLCQHPNWMGNLLIWSGILVLNIPTLLAGASHPHGATAWRQYLRLGCATLSPLFLFALFSGQANDTIGNAVALSKAKYGSDGAFLAYLEKTPLLFPTVRSTVAFFRSLVAGQ